MYYCVMEEEKKFSGQREEGGPYISRGQPEFAPDANCLFKRRKFSSFASFCKFYILGSKGAWCSVRTAGTWMALIGATLGANLGAILGQLTWPVSDELLTSLKEVSIKGGRFLSVSDA
jgi:hypothetical protein